MLLVDGGNTAVPFLLSYFWIFHSHLLLFRVYHLSYHLTMHHLFNQIYYPPIFQHSNLLQSNLSICSSSPWFQFTAEPSESLLIITLTLESSPLIMPTYQVFTGSEHAGTRRLWRIRQWHIQSVSSHGSHWESTPPMDLSIVTVLLSVEIWNQFELLLASLQ